MEVFAALMNKIDSGIWGLPMLVLLCGTHIFMTFRTGFIQRKTFTGIRLSVTKDPDSPGDVSQFQALTTALASTIGTGNIIGVGTAIYLGGPGAVLWCWLTGVFGIATKYAESLIAVKYRVQTADGRMMGGAMYALERGLKWKKFGKVMAVLFALFAMLASFGIGCGTQINAIAEVLETNLPISLPRIAIGIVFGIITAIIIIGGIESIAVVCEKLVPLMALFYVVGCIVILCANYDFLLPALKAIFVLAFKPGAVTGGLVGGGIRLALQYGVARGLFSNESGMGSAPLVASAAQTRNPVLCIFYFIKCIRLILHHSHLPLSAFRFHLLLDRDNHTVLVGRFQHTGQLRAVFQQHLHLVSDVLDVLAKYLERRSNAGGANLQLIILDVTIQMLLQIPAQLSAIINAYRFIVINFNDYQVPRFNHYVY